MPNRLIRMESTRCLTSTGWLVENISRGRRTRTRQRDGQSPDENDEADVVGRDDLADHADGVDLDADIAVACVSSIWVTIELPPISVPTR
jgi:hypothetical protein